MADIKRNALMPKGDTNGLAGIAPELCSEAAHRAERKIRAAVILYDARRLAIDSDTGDELVTIRIRRIEPVLLGDLPTAEKLVRRSLESRSDQTTLPLELEDELERAFREAAEAIRDDPEGDGKGKGEGK